MTLKRSEYLFALFVAFVAGVGTVTGLGYCMACKNRDRIEALEQRDEHKAALLKDDAIRLVELEASHGND